MTDDEALNILRAEGHPGGIPDREGWVRVWSHRSHDDDAIEVRAGRELHELAEGKLRFEEICELREASYQSSAEQRRILSNRTNQTVRL